MKNIFDFLLAVCLFGAGAALAQSVVDLPASLADPGTMVQAVLTQDPRAGQNNRTLGLTEGPAVDSSGNLFFSELGSAATGMKIWRVPPTGPTTVFFEPSNNSNGLDFDFQGRLVAVQNGLVTRFNQNGSRDTLIRNGNGLTLGSLNDLSFASTGHMMMTNYSGNKIFLLNPSGSLIDSLTVAGNPNGIEYIEETQTVYLNLSGTNRVARFNWSPNMGTAFRVAAANRTDFIPRVSIPDGITLDSLENFYVASNSIGTVVVYSPAGDSIGRITVRARAMANVTNCVFGGPGNRTLYITGNGGSYRVQLRVAGRRRPAGTTAIHMGRIESLDRKNAKKGAFDLVGRSTPRWKDFGMRKIVLVKQ